MLLHLAATELELEHPELKCFSFGIWVWKNQNIAVE